MQDPLIAQLAPIVKDRFRKGLEQQPMLHVASIDWVEGVVRGVVQALGEAMLDAWTVAVEQVALEVGSCCPSCSKPRKCKRRPGQPMQISLLGHCIDLPKLYLECGHCPAPGVSITKLLTGLRSGDTSAELKLSAAYLAAEHSYGKASRDLGVHHGQDIERTLVRRMALEVEQQAMVFVEEERRQALAKAREEVQPEGVERLMLQGDGGSVRTGTLVPCQPGDPGYGKTTPSTGRPRRKRLSQGRELITLDVREPGQETSIGLDVVVPSRSQEGERARRMLALAMRMGLGSNTQMIGLGDMGSSLPASFKEAFVGRDDAFYSTDWKHICDYVRNASTVLEELDVKRWRKQMRDAIWRRDLRRRDKLLEEANQHRVRQLPAHLHKCPLAALATYLTNNWQHMHAARLKELDLDYVSARAEAQVRDRTKSRFSVPGAWREENLEPKASLRSIIAEGRWERFREHYLERQNAGFTQRLKQRLEQARTEGRLHHGSSKCSDDPMPAKAA